MIHSLIAQAYYRRTPVWRRYAYLRQSQYWPTEVLHYLQLQKLQRLLSVVENSSDYWRHRFQQYGVGGRRLKTLADWQQFPIMEKQDIDQMLRVDQPDTARLVRKRTGGSTGEPVTLYASPDHVWWSMAAMLRFYEWMGYKPGDRRAKLFAAPTHTGVPESTLRNRARNLLSNTLYLNALQMEPDHVIEMAARLRRFAPTLLVGYTSSMATMARTLHARGEPLGISPLTIMNAAEPLDAPRRALIEHGLGGRLYDHYGTRDVGYVADECKRHTGLHVHMEYLIVEVVDEHGQWMPPGEEGDILITELENRGMPTMRYRLGDRGVMADHACGCGRGLPLLSAIVGRSTDVIVLPNGNRLTGLVFPHLLKDFPVTEYQIVQKRVDMVEVALVLAEGLQTAGILHQIQTALQSILTGVELRISQVESIPRTKSGKLRSVISEGPTIDP